MQCSSCILTDTYWTCLVEKKMKPKLVTVLLFIITMSPLLPSIVIVIPIYAENVSGSSVTMNKEENSDFNKSNFLTGKPVNLIPSDDYRDTENTRLLPIILIMSLVVTIIIVFFIILYTIKKRRIK